MLKKISPFRFSPGLPVRRGIFLILPAILLLSLMTSCQEPEVPEDTYRNTMLRPVLNKETDLKNIARLHLTIGRGQ